MARLALFDLDGTLSDDSERAQFFIQGQPTEYWDRDKMLADPIFPGAFNLIRGLESVDTHIGILSARQDELNRKVTQQWLDSFDLNPAYVILKPKRFSYMKPEEFKCMKLASILADDEFTDVVFYENERGVVDYINARLPGEHAQWVEWNQTE